MRQSVFIHRPKEWIVYLQGPPCTINLTIHIDSISLHHRSGTLGSVTNTCRDDTLLQPPPSLYHTYCTESFMWYSKLRRNVPWHRRSSAVLYTHSIVVMTWTLFTLSVNVNIFTSSAFRTRWQSLTCQWWCKINANAENDHRTQSLCERYHHWHNVKLGRWGKRTLWT